METLFIENAPYVEGIHKQLFRLLTRHKFDEYFTSQLCNAAWPENAGQLWQLVEQSDEIWYCSCLDGISRELFDRLLLKAERHNLTNKSIFNMNSREDVVLPRPELVQYLSNERNIKFFYFDDIKKYFQTTKSI
jgi:hypothetical protein